MKNNLQCLLISLLILFSTAQSYAEIYPRRDKVILVFIPGIYGSVLRDSNGNTLWGENGISRRGLSLVDIPEATPELYSDVSFNIAVFRKTIRGYSGFDARANFLVGEPLVFPYDWRKSNKKSAAVLDAFLCEKIPQIQKPYRVVFLAHSMGGLVLRHWIKDFLDRGNAGCGALKQEDIGQFVFVGTPHLGAMETVAALVSGETGMERNPIYATLFTGGMAAYAATFESSYELLPAANIAGPDCSGMSQRYANKLRVDIGTGTNPPLYLNDVRKWEQLGLPAELPPEMSRQHFLELAEERLEAASQIVCELNSYSIPARIALKMNFVIGELAEPGGDRNIIDSTWDTIELDARPGRTITHSGSHAKGDGTVPYWSAEPEAVNSKTILNLPHATEFEHAELLDDAHVVSHLQRIVDRAATDVAWLTAEPLGRPISTVAEWEETRQELVNYGLEKTSPEIVAAAIGTLSANAELLDISGLDLYRDARKYNGDSELAYKAVGFTVAAAIESGLNDRSVLWANQNSSYYWLKAGNTNMSVETALRTGKLASDFYNEGDPDPDLSKVELNSIEKKWRGVLLSERVEATDPDIIGVIADFENYDPNLFDQAKGLGYGNLEYRNPYLFVSPPT